MLRAYSEDAQQMGAIYSNLFIISIHQLDIVLKYVDVWFLASIDINAQHDELQSTQIFVRDM